ncbi:CYTH domain-containing protein [Jiella sp. MQZ9-1]|uniref:CYTH domain-containing protein n=1 Tax=Jiella flava TaxID=2816857 RepID=A0A939FXG9_9HYPH|nr:CYTH domain-containing protein [Jiella flava]MBO0662006.1 CYTH domain-containing protein [Jiella flava]MCD2470667.1 CYTH domain-containing protein [Jiella flava]
MGREIERKFLVTDESWLPLATRSNAFSQFYLFAEADRSCRVRIVDRQFARLTLKTGDGIDRGEFEYDIPLDDAKALRASAVGRLIEKTRHFVPNGPHTIEVDVFHGGLTGLIVAEIELSDEAEAFTRPRFLGKEVSGDPRYLNRSLSLHGLPSG